MFALVNTFPNEPGSQSVIHGFLPGPAAFAGGLQSLNDFANSTSMAFIFFTARVGKAPGTAAGMKAVTPNCTQQ
jgi:hypothetical protein